MSRGIVLSVEARAQLDHLYDHIAAAASPGTALGFVNAILDQLQTLQEFPNLGVSREDVLPGLRTLGFRRRVTIAFVVEPLDHFPPKWMPVRRRKWSHFKNLRAFGGSREPPNALADDAI